MFLGVYSSILQPQFYTIEKHLSSPKPADRHALYIIKKLREHGFAAYIVGGWVRDLLLGASPKDLDISTSAKPEEIKAIFNNCILIGKRFRLAHIRFGKTIVEVATFRTGDLENSSLIVHDNTFGSEEDDVLRRDFTINGLFYDLESEVIIDYVGGYLDAKNKLLRSIGEPVSRFRQDPVRMLRLLKFQARFGLSVEKKTLDALKICRKDITKSSQARILEELLRMLESGFSAPFIKNLAKFGLIELLLPAIEEKMLAYVLQFLKEADQDTEKTHLLRPVLVSCLCYPLFVQNLQKKAERKPLHLQAISAVAAESIDAIFSPFFQLPRKMKGAILYILTAQCRFTPVEENPTKKRRIPFDTSLPLALKFFELRSKIQPELEDKYAFYRDLCKKILAKKTRKKRPRKTVEKTS